MQNHLDDVDRTVMSLRAVVEGKLDQTTVFGFEICVSEVLTNIVKHAQSARKDDPIKVVLSETHEALIVEVFDPIGAQAFDLRKHAPDLENVDAMAESGRGLGIIMQCAGGVQYGPKGDGNRLALEFLK